MPVQVIWDNAEKTVLRYDVQDRWTWEEFFAAIQQAQAMMAGRQEIIHFIVNPLDKKSRGYLPPNTVRHVVQLYRSAPPNAGSTVVIGGGGFFRTFNDVSQRFYPHIARRYYFADTLEEARQILSKQIT